MILQLSKEFLSSRTTASGFRCSGPKAKKHSDRLNEG
jgi:hypothetical protein